MVQTVVENYAQKIAMAVENAMNSQEYAYVIKNFGVQIVQKKDALMIVLEMVNVLMDCVSVMLDFQEIVVQIGNVC
jgi:hypothetical protein